jgi:outer membrane protein OmpA-like peptidoglycan-associated protein
MNFPLPRHFGLVAVLMLASAASHAAPPDAAKAPDAATVPDAAKAPDAIVVYFGPGSTAISAAEAAKLDQAARLYREGQPLLMTVAGGTDSVGNPVANLRISQRRADAVFQGLVARGIPAERFQVVAKGETQPAVQNQDGVPEPKNRDAVITWK